jgi:hypothetical protein
LSLPEHLDHQTLAIKYNLEYADSLDELTRAPADII